jgi:polar amino acid transport system substrate-binding protein
VIRSALDFIDYLNSGVQFYTLASTADVSAPIDLCGKTIGTSRSTAFPAEINTWSDINCVAAGKAPITVEGPSPSSKSRSTARLRPDAGLRGLAWGDR